MAKVRSFYLVLCDGEDALSIKSRKKEERDEEKSREEGRYSNTLVLGYESDPVRRVEGARDRETQAGHHQCHPAGRRAPFSLHNIPHGLSQLGGQGGRQLIERALWSLPVSGQVPARVCLRRPRPEPSRRERSEVFLHLDEQRYQRSQGGRSGESMNENDGDGEDDDDDD
eukprot:763007-Hanusia_phi.AAC.1